MNTEAQNSFLHAVKKIINPALKKRIEKAITSVENAKTVKDIPHLKKLESKKNIHYRIRVGSYRIGITIEGDMVTFVDFKDRKELYKYFPKKNE
jgi:mRNA interferase RelE/StbE